MISISFHTDGAWGTGLDRNLTAAEVDHNFANLKTAVEALQTNPPSGAAIASIAEDNNFNVFITLTSGAVLGPFPFPILEWNFRGAWTPFTVFKALDSFVVDGSGLYVVMIGHTSGSTFDAAVQVTGQPALKLMMGMDSGPYANVYDVTLWYPGRPSDSTNSKVLVFPALRAVMLPIAAGNHVATLTDAPATTQQVYPVFHNSTQIGTITFAVDSAVGVIAWSISEDEAIAQFDDLSIGKSSTAADGVAAGLSIGLALQRVVTP